MKRIYLLFFLIVIVISCYAENNHRKIPSFAEIEGLYRIVGQTNIGLEVKKIDEESYIFRKIFINENGDIHRFEWQGAYVKKNEENDYLFYWHTGRFDDEKPETNGIIVYKLKATDSGFDGNYFFPEESRNPSSNVIYEKFQ